MRFSQITNELLQIANSMGMTGWAIAGAVLVTLGVICMRGYGSRDNY